jgi:hypothetical protein
MQSAPAGSRVDLASDDQVLIVRPGSAHRSEHVAAHDPGAEILERACREVVVDAGRPAISPLDLPLEGAGWKEPLVQLFAAAAERLVAALSGPAPKPSADTVEAFTRSIDIRLVPASFTLGSCQQPPPQSSRPRAPE